MNNWVYRSIVVPDALVQYARDLTAAVAGEAGTGMYSAALSQDSTEPATYWISAGLISKKFADLLPLTTYPAYPAYPADSADSEPIHQMGHPEIVAAVATSNGYPTTAEEVRTLLEAADITEQDAMQVLQRLDLKMVQPSVDTTSE